MTKTSECELRKLGEDAPVHEELKRLMDEEFKRIRSFMCGGSRLDNLIMVDVAHNNKNYLTELIQIRKKHGLPSDSRCYKCLGDKCSWL